MKRRKTLMDWVNEYVTLRQDLGFRMETERGELVRFARYVTASGNQGPLTRELILAWLQSSPHASRTYQARRLATLRSFAKYLAIYEPRTEIPPARIVGPAGSPPEPHIPGRYANMFGSATSITPLLNRKLFCSPNKVAGFRIERCAGSFESYAVSWGGTVRSAVSGAPGSRTCATALPAAGF